MQGLTTILLKIPRDTEVTPEAAQNFLAAFTQIGGRPSGLKKLLGRGNPPVFSLEIALIDQRIYFLITASTELMSFINGQIQSNYPLVISQNIEDPVKGRDLRVVELTLKKGSFFPILTYPSFEEIDPLSSILSVLSNRPTSELAFIQFSLAAAGSGWQTHGQSFAEQGTQNEEGKWSPRPDADIIKTKISYPGFYSSFRIAAEHKATLDQLASAFGVFSKADGNSFGKRSRRLTTKRKLARELLARETCDSQVLNIAELATLWHLPSLKVKTASIAWGKSVLSEAPDNLPVAVSMTEEQKRDTNFFAKAQYQNQNATFGIKSTDRRRHTWVIGKTGTGKSTLIANMVIDDIKKDRGIAVIDPHGDLCETILDYVPRHRINDVIYFNPSDRDYPVIINPLEVASHEEGELVVSGLMSIFTKIWANVWSARMEYILRNTLLTLTQVPGTTFNDVLGILANRSFRNSIVRRISDQSLVKFWEEEYNQMPERLQKEAISPIQNKVGQFVTSPMIRRIIGEEKSTVHIDSVMNNGKILLANLSQGRLGEDNSALLGATLITKIQQAAMRRVNIPEQERRDFFLYVDEFQNFATTSFIKILSEARKYRLNLMLANQYMAQIPEDVQKAILGNVGSLVSFGVGADDAEIIHKEYAEVFSQNDLVGLSNYQVAVKLMIDGHSSRPFIAHTLPLPASRNQNRPKVIEASRAQWSKREGFHGDLGQYRRWDEQIKQAKEKQEKANEQKKERQEPHRKQT